MQRITILGSTGSIGRSTLDVLRLHTEKFCVEALTGNQNVILLAQQCIEFKPRYAVVLENHLAQKLRADLQQASCSTEVLCGENALLQVAADSGSSIVMAAIVGARGLLPTLKAVQAGKKVLLANKEVLVSAGKIFAEVLPKTTATLIPIDSEHSAIFQCLAGFKPLIDRDQKIESLTLTASGGPFRTWPLHQFDAITSEQALKHPTWNMGAKISIDSATMMNKGLEVIEAHWLFNIPADKIEVVIHPQSIIHSIVNFIDGSMLAQMGMNDMRIPIAYGLAYPQRFSSGVPKLDLIKLATLHFEPMDWNRYPCLRLAYAALSADGSASCILNAANEVAVDLFLKKMIGFTQIASLVEEALEQIPNTNPHCIEEVMQIDQKTRHLVEKNHLTYKI